MTASVLPSYWIYEMVERDSDGNLCVNTVKIDENLYLRNDRIISEDCSKLNMYDDQSHSDEEDNYYTNEKYWDTLDTQLKEFACPKYKSLNSIRTFKNEDNIIPFPKQIKKQETYYLVPNSKFKEKEKLWFYYNPERHIAKLVLEEEYSRMILRNLINTGMLKNIDKVISIGNQAIILHANCNTSYQHFKLPNDCVIKFFKTKIEDTIAAKPFVKPDFKIRELFTKNTRQVIRQWGQDEFETLHTMEKIGINCPKPLFVKSHYIIMSYIGDDKGPAPTLATLNLKEKEWEHIYSLVMNDMEKLYNGGLVHGDLSEHNILWWGKKCWFIDVPQALPADHHKASEYLWRDCKTITRFFENKLRHKVKRPQKLYTTLSSQEF